MQTETAHYIVVILGDKAFLRSRPCEKSIRDGGGPATSEAAKG